MNRQTLTYLAITAVLIVLAVFGSEVTQEAQIKHAESNKCCTKDQLNSFNLKLETTACYGTCPVFSLEISNLGKLNVVGKEYVDFKVLDKVLTEEQLTYIGKLIYQSNYFETENIYGYRGKGCLSIATDNPSSNWDIRIGKESKTISYYKGCLGAPKELAVLEEELIRRLGLETELL